MTIPDYGKIEALSRFADVLSGEGLIVEEKIDGSQFSFTKRVLDDAAPTLYELSFRSRNQTVDSNNAGMFAQGVGAIMDRCDKLTPGVVYRGEYLAKPRHNVLNYGRIPRGHTMLWDLTNTAGRIRDRGLLETTAEQADLEAVPVLHTGPIESMGFLASLIAGRDSILGGPLEGVVIKSSAGVAKLVTDQFKEVKGTPRLRLTDKDLHLEIGRCYGTPARWAKAVGKLRDAGQLTGTVKDIGPLVRAVQEDVWAEERGSIVEAVLAYHTGSINKAVSAGVAEWYKDVLAREAHGNG